VDLAKQVLALDRLRFGNQVAEAVVVVPLLEQQSPVSRREEVI
jgi:hypothetical protein